MQLKTMIFLLVILFCGCKSEPCTITIDNPTSEKIKIQLGHSEPIILAPNQLEHVEIPAKKTSLTINNKVMDKLKLSANQSYLLNPSLHTYYVEDIVYHTTSSGMKNYKRDYGTPQSQIGNYTVNGIFEKIDSTLLISKQWKYGLDEMPKSSLVIADDYDKGYYTFTKLHREKDLKKEILDIAVEELFPNLKDTTHNQVIK